MMMRIPPLLLVLLLFCVATEGWIVSSPIITTTRSKTYSPRHKAVVGLASIIIDNRNQSRRNAAQTRTTTTRIFSSPKDDNDNEKEEEGSGGPLDFIFNPGKSEIPPELKDEIYRAEGNTQAAKDRTIRILLYAVLAVAGISVAFFNGFLTELRKEESDLANVGLGWVESNFATKFLFLNKIGGGLSLLSGAGAGLLAEAEYDTRRINAENIYKEMARRKAQKEQKENKKKNKKNRRGGGDVVSTTTKGGKKKKKRRSGKERKRLEALSEVILPDAVAEKEEEPQQPEAAAAAATTTKTPSTEEKGDDGGGILGSLKDFYQQADTMAATQARLLNKKLEDEGVLEKITDESGLKVIGRDEAAKLQKEKENETGRDDKPQTKE